MKAVQGFVRVFRHWRYCLVALSAALLSYAALVIVPQYKIVAFFWSLPVGLLRKVFFIYSIGRGFVYSNEFLNVLYVIVISLLFGLNSAVFIYFYRRIREGFDSQSATATLGGSFFAVLGAGCASCGTFMATYVLGLIGAQGLLVWLPLGGREFALVGVIGLVWALYLICKKIVE